MRELQQFFTAVQAICGPGELTGGGGVRAITIPEIEFRQALELTPNTIVANRHPDQRDHIEWKRDRVDIDTRIGGDVKTIGDKLRWSPDDRCKLFQLGVDGTRAGEFYLLVRNGRDVVLVVEYDCLRKAGSSEIPASVQQALLVGTHNPDRWLS